MATVEREIVAIDMDEPMPVSSDNAALKSGGDKKKNYRHLKLAKPLKSTWEKKMKDKSLGKMVKARQVEIREKLSGEKADRLREKQEREERRKENERKGETVQVIRNMAKLKRMKKKQLKKIQKRDIT